MLTSPNMPRSSTTLAPAEEAAKALLGGADPASVPSDQLLAAIDALTQQKSVAAANVLSRISAPKDAAKAARRALFRLQTQGIRTDQQPEVETPAVESKPAAARIVLLEGQISSYDPRGTRAVSVLAEKPFTGLVS